MTDKYYQYKLETVSVQFKLILKQNNNKKSYVQLSNHNIKPAGIAQHKTKTTTKLFPQKYKNHPPCCIFVCFEKKSRDFFLHLAP